MDSPETVISLPFGDAPVLELTSTALVVALVPAQGEEQPYLEVSELLPDACRPLVTREGNTVRVRMESVQPFPFALWDLGPRVHMTLHVPAAVRAHVHIDAGRVRVRGLSGGEVNLETAAGVLSLKDVKGNIRLRAGAGKVTGERLSGMLDVETNAGAVHLSVEQLDAGTHRVRSSMGAVRVDLAAGQKVAIEASATMGSARISYPSAPDADAKLIVQTELGSVRVREMGHTQPESTPEDDPASFMPGVAWRWGGGRGRGRHRHPPHAWAEWAQGWWPPPPQRSQSPDKRGEPVSDDELRRVLNLVQEGKLTAEEAQKILRAMER
jgi:hypothetical protein